MENQESTLLVSLDPQPFLCYPDRKNTACAVDGYSTYKMLGLGPNFLSY